MVSAALAASAYHAAESFDRGNPLVAELQAYLLLRDSLGDKLGGNLGRPAPGMLGLEPDAAKRREITCVDAQADWGGPDYGRRRAALLFRQA